MINQQQRMQKEQLVLVWMTVELTAVMIQRLLEVYKTKSKSQYERFLKMLQEKGILCRGYMNDYNCIFEIRFL